LHIKAVGCAAHPRTAHVIPVTRRDSSCRKPVAICGLRPARKKVPFRALNPALSDAWKVADTTTCRTDVQGHRVDWVDFDLGC
jgi:hypothetical protein